MAVSRFVRPMKRQYGMWAKLIAVGVLGLCFVVVWSLFSSSSSSVVLRRESFGGVGEPVADGAARGSGSKGGGYGGQSRKEEDVGRREDVGEDGERARFEPVVDSIGRGRGSVNESSGLAGDGRRGSGKGGKEELAGARKGEGGAGVDKKGGDAEGEGNGEGGEEDGDEELILDGEGEGVDQEVESREERERESDDPGESTDGDNAGNEEREVGGPGGTVDKGKKAKKGPVFDPKARYIWKLCRTRSKHNYIPCIDNEGGGGREIAGLSA